MEKRLRSSLQSSADEFISSVLKLSLKSSKLSLKTLIHSIKPSSDLASSLPIALHRSISQHVVSFQDLLRDPSSCPSPSNSPLSKRRRRGCTAETETSRPDTQQVLDSLRTLAYIVCLCGSNPKKVFSSSDLLPAAQLLHDNLILFEQDQVLCNEIAGLCEGWWKDALVGRETLISQSLPYILSRSLTLKKKVDVHRVYALRDAFALFDFEDESIEDLRMLIMRCIVSPLFIKTEDGRRFVASAFGLSRHLLKAGIAVVKAQIPLARKSVLEGYGEILFRAWMGMDEDLKAEIENGFLQGLIEGAILAGSREFAASLRRVLGGFINQRTTEGVEKLLFRLAEPVIFRSLQVANSSVRLNSLHLLLDLFPMEDPDATKEAKDTLLDRQFYLLERLLMDDCPDIRVVAVEGCCRVLHLFWEVIPSSTITKIITKILDDKTHDWCNEVRLSTVNGIIYLLGNPQSHEILKVLLPRMGHLMLDNVAAVRVAVVDLLLLLKGIRNFQFSKVVSVDALLSALATDQAKVAERITKLLMPSYFPSRLTTDEACDRCVALLKRNPAAGAMFCKFIISLGAPPKSALQLAKVLVDLVLSSDKFDANQIEGMLLAVAHLCKDLAADSSYSDTLKEIFLDGNLKGLLNAAPTAQARSAVLEYVSLISPDNASNLLGDCLRSVVNSSGLLGDKGRQNELRSIHKLFLSCNAFNDLLAAFTRVMEKTAYRCHINFGCEIEKQNHSSMKRKKSKAFSKSSVGWKHISGEKVSSFEEDYANAVGVSWQIKDLLASQDSRTALLESEIENLFSALKVVSEASIVQSSNCEYMDPYPVLAYTALALHMTILNSSCENDYGTRKNATLRKMKVLDHTLNCTNKLFQAGDSETVSNSKKTASKRSSQRHKEPQTSISKACENGSVYAKQRKILNKIKILTGILKFIADSTEMGFSSDFQDRTLNFTSSYLKYIVSTFGHQSTDQLLFEEVDFKDITLCLKSSMSYSLKFLNLVLRDIIEASSPSFGPFNLANDILDLFESIELSLGPAYAARLVAASNQWVPDLVLALGYCFIHRSYEAESSYATSFDHIKSRFPSWLQMLAKIEVLEISEADQEEAAAEDKVSEPMELPVFKKLIDMLHLLLKGNSKIRDSIGLVFLIGSAVGLEMKDSGLVLGLLHFLCVKLIGKEDREWKGLDMMLAYLPGIYPLIEKEIEEEQNEYEVKQLQAAKQLLEPVWFYHVYETQRFSMNEEQG